jgi:hypothetical protein
MSSFLCIASLLLTLCPFLFPLSSGPRPEWLPVNPEELKMASEPNAPGAPAIYLYRQVDRDDVENREFTYARIKIFTEEGRKYADIELPFLKGMWDIKDIQARTIRPDGTILDFSGTIFDKSIVKAKGIKYFAKTFTLPDVQPGSIIEYRYTRTTRSLYDSRWILSEELFTKRAKFSLRQNMHYSLQWRSPRGLPEGTAPPALDKNVIRMESQNVPAFQIEDFMPPPDEMKYRVEFMYTRILKQDVDQFWSLENAELYPPIQAFIDSPQAMKQALAQIISPSDTPDQKLRKIYDRCQKIRNLSYESEKTHQELKRENLKPVRTVADVWKYSYGKSSDITWLFLALVRAAGFDASPLVISTRDKYFFNPTLRNPYDLDADVVLVKLKDQELYLDPSIPVAPFGLLPWYETAVSGLRVDTAFALWVTTSLPDPSQSGVDRKATLQLNSSGDLEGNVVITFKGLTALAHRMEQLGSDNAQRKKSLEDELKTYIPLSSEVELTNVPDWDSPTMHLIAEYKVKIPGWASQAGRRMLLAVGLFGGGEKHLFESSHRIHPIYINFPYSDSDDVIITPPAGTAIAEIPKPQHDDEKRCLYDLRAEKKNGNLQLKRTLMVDLPVLKPEYYPAVRSFFERVRSGDDQQAVLSSSDPQS